MTLEIKIRDINGIQTLDILKAVDQRLEELKISDKNMEVHHYAAEH